MAIIKYVVLAKQHKIDLIIEAGIKLVFRKLMVFADLYTGNFFRKCRNCSLDSEYLYQLNIWFHYQFGFDELLVS